MKQVILLKGLPGSGKSTWARKKIEEEPGRYKRINKDELRAMLDNSSWSKHNEKFILQVRDDLILKALEEGKHVIVDDTNLHPKHETNIRNLVKGLAEVRVKEFDTSISECIKRDLKRPNSVGPSVIKRMHQQFSDEVEEVTFDENNPCAFIFDIDGTLALMKNRSPYSWSEVGEDAVNKPVLEVLRALQVVGFKIIIFTGRDGCCEDLTREWLARYNIRYDYFAIRPAGNTEKDSIIKRRMLEEVRKKYNILGVFDDRNQVVEMWRSIGLTCFQVADGDF